jgi:hypothetical protein
MGSMAHLEDEDGLVMKTLRVGASGVLSNLPIHLSLPSLQGSRPAAWHK